MAASLTLVLMGEVVSIIWIPTAVIVRRDMREISVKLVSIISNSSSSGGGGSGGWPNTKRSVVRQAG